MSKRNAKKNNVKSKKPVIIEQDSDEENKYKSEDNDIYQDDQENDNLSDDKNEIDDEDKEINNDDDDKDDDDKDDQKKHDYDNDKCVYNYVEDKSDDEIDLMFDDDIISESSDVVPTNQRRTKPILSKYEKTRLLGDRTQQLTLGAKPMIKNVNNMDPKNIAEEEIKQNVIPLKIQRPLPNGKKEIWYIHELKH